MANVDRIIRVEELVKREVAAIIQDKLIDPRLGLVTVTGVKVSRDLGYADIRLSVMGGDKTESGTLDILNGAAGFIRTELGNVIVMKKIPRLRFHPDEEYKKAMRIYEILNDIETSDEL